MVYTKRDNLHHGFTMIELLIVITVLGLLFTGGIVSYNWWTRQAAQTATRATIQADAIALRAYYQHTGKYPEKLRNLLKKPTNPEEAADWDGPYVETDKAFKDGWKKKLIYRTSDNRQSFELYSSKSKKLRVTSE